VAVAKATEIFLAQVVEQSHQVCKKKKRKTIKVRNTTTHAFRRRIGDGKYETDLIDAFRPPSCACITYRLTT
jgi:histone H3/H4